MREVASGQQWRVEQVGDGDRRRWEELYSGYARAAGRSLDPGHLNRVWSWISDPAAQTRCLLLCEPSGRAVGLAHYRPFERPLAGSIGCYVDDVYVEAGSAGRGGATALLSHLAEISRAEGWSIVRWTTGEANQRAQALYDRLAERSPVVTYVLDPHHEDAVAR